MYRNKRGKRRRLLLLLVLIAMAAIFIQSEWFGRTVYPISYVEEIKRGAERYDLDPLLIAAIIKVESNFKKDAVSHKGALGIMQVMPDTAKWILGKEDFGSLTVEDVGKDVRSGITIGSWYVKDLHRQFDGDRTKALAAYNAGPGKVRQWLEEGVWDGSEDTLENIPYGETRHYVERVYYYYKKYLKVYETL